ncbi:hypothetical protein VTI74DRAFT_8503 [Chaetomium olivicolor]
MPKVPVDGSQRQPHEAARVAGQRTRVVITGRRRNHRLIFPWRRKPSATSCLCLGWKRPCGSSQEASETWRRESVTDCQAHLVETFASRYALVPMH